MDKFLYNWNYILELKQKQLKTTSDAEYNEIKCLINDIFKTILCRNEINKKYFIKGDPNKRNFIIRKYKINRKECIEIPDDYEKIIAFNKLSGIPGKIICLYENNIELVALRKLINTLIY